MSRRHHGCTPLTSGEDAAELPPAAARDGDDVDRVATGPFARTGGPPMPAKKSTPSPSRRSSTAAPSTRRKQSVPAVDAAGTDVDAAALIDVTGSGGETHQVAAGGRPRLTTQQGVPVADDQNTLRVGERGPSLLEDFHFREKIFHFDHERIPERVVHARGFGAHGFFEPYESLADVDARRPVPAARRAHPGVRALLDGGRQQGLVRPRPRRARLRREVLHAGGQLGPRRQQHPGVLHPGRDQVPRPRPLGRSRSPTAGSRRPSRRTTTSGTSSR